MAEVLVLVDHEGGELKKVSYELLAAAARLGEPSAVVVGAPGTAEGMTEGLAAHGAAKIYVTESEDAANYLTTPSVNALASLVESVQPAAVVVNTSADGKEIAGKLAVRTGNGLLNDVVDLADDGTSTHSVFGGSYLAKAKVTTSTPIISLRANSVEPVESAGAGASESVEVPAVDTGKVAKVTDRKPVEGGDRPELTEASVVVSGGRGVGSADNFSVIENLADALGAAVGASRAAVDSGYYPNQFQVGQTGKTVSPQLYVALGISGAIQHRAGMQTSKTIVAVNKDAEAPIFEIADFGVVGDLFTIAPHVAEEASKRKG